MDALIPALSFWGHMSAGFAFVALAGWIFHKYGAANRQQTLLLGALIATSAWGLTAAFESPLGS